MFTARDYLNSEADAQINLLREEFKTGRQRLSREFLEIALDVNAPFNFRSRALMVLSRHSNEVCAAMPEVADVLRNAFDAEFSEVRLKAISEQNAGENCNADGFLLYEFCILLAKVAPESALESINTAKGALKGTSLESTLTNTVAAIARNR